MILLMKNVIAINIVIFVEGVIKTHDVDRTSLDILDMGIARLVTY